MDPKKKSAAGADRKKEQKSKKQQSTAVEFILTVVKMLTVFFVALACAITGIIGGAIYAYIKTVQPITPEQINLKNLTSFVYDMNGKEIAQLKGLENRILVEHQDVSDNLRNAFVALEDERFYQHPGVDWKRIASAAVSFVVNLGDAKHGASTITQQLVRNITGNTERSIRRKVQEQVQALWLESKLSKEEILDNYMNRIYMGHGCYGVQSASKLYFNKDVKYLSLAECASLAGITNNPSIYDPFTEKGRENIKKREKTALEKMLQLEKITQKDFDIAMAEELVFTERDDSTLVSTRVQSYFVDQVVSDVQNDLVKKLNMSRDEAITAIYNSGFKIYTTQDSDMQKIMDDVFTDDKYFPAIKGRYEHPQAAMVIIDPWTGQVRALYGGYGEKKGDLVLNRATQTERQPGSSFKPIAVYGPALDKGLISAATIVDDVPVYMDTQHKDRMYPTNYESGKYEGLSSIHDAIRRSQNVVAAKVWRDILGPDLSIQYLKKVGINRENEKYVSLALGGLNKGVNPLIMASAYVPFINKGQYFEPITYTKVLDRNGKVILEKKPMQKKTIVYDETTAFIMANMMKDVCSAPGGTANPYGIIKNGKGMTIATAGKTGTSGSFIDKWFIGYSPYYVGAVWYGYDNRNNVPIRLQQGEWNQALIIWHDVMEKVHKDLSPADFSEPQGLVKKAVCIYSGKTPTQLCYKDPRGNAVRYEYFVKGTEPADDDVCDVHISAKICTASKDAYGRFLLAGPNCPGETVKEVVLIQRKEEYMPVKPDDPFPVDWRYESPAGEYCTVHGGNSKANVQQPLPGTENKPILSPAAGR